MFYASALIVQMEAGGKKWRFMFGEKQKTCTELKGPLYLGILLFFVPFSIFEHCTFLYLAILGLHFENNVGSA